MVSPYETLQPRRMRRGPLRSNEMTDILQSIRPHWEVDFPVNVSIDIDQTLCDIFRISIVAFCELRYRSWLVTPVMIDWRRAQLQVRGLVQAEQSIKASVDPSEPKVQEMVETVLTPPHPDPFEALLNEPFTRTLDHATTQR